MSDVAADQAANAAGAVGPSAASDTPPQARGRVLTPLNLLGKLTNAFTQPAAMAVEIVVLPLVALAIGLLLAPQDPFQIRGAFPWPWLAPLLVALRYGPLAGIGGVAILLLSWLGLNVGQIGTFPEAYFLGGLILVMLTGEFASVWQDRTHRAETVQFYLDQRFQQLLHQHYLLRLSHDRLARELIGRPMSMHDALVALRDVEHDHADGMRGAAALLRVLVQYCQIDCAALHAVNGGAINAQPAAVIGAYQALDEDDPMVRQALATGRLCHIGEAVTARQDSRYLVVAPLLDLGGAAYGLLVIQDMPFLALQTENLQALQLLLSCYTDNVSMSLLARPLTDKYPDCPLEFAFELQRLEHVYAIAQLQSVVLVLDMDSADQAQHMQLKVEEIKDELDLVWLIVGASHSVLALLIPLGDTAVADGYVAKLGAWVRSERQSTLEQAGVTAHVLEMDGDPAARTVERIRAIAAR